MNFRTKRWTKRFDFFALTSWLILSLGLAIVSLVWFGVDFRGYYAAARVLMMGGNPYDYRQVAPVLLRVTGEMGNNPYYYPPWFAWLFLPLAMLPFQIARAIWMTINLILWNISLWKLSEIFKWPPKGWRRYSFFILVTLTFGWITWRYEQAAILIFAILVATILSIHNEHWNRVGLWLVLLLIKPNISLIVVATLSFWLIRQHRWRPILVMLIMLVILLAISTWITPNWFQPLFEPGFGQGLTMALDGPNQIVQARKNTTISDWLAIFGIGGYLRLCIYGLATLVGVFILFWTILRSKSLLELTSISLLVSYALTPYALQYDYPPLVVVLFWALFLCTSSPKAMRGSLFLAGFVFSVSIWQQNIAWGYWMVVGLIAMGIWGLFQNNANEPVHSLQS
jgi:hypothetical protein